MQDHLLVLPSMAFIEREDRLGENAPYEVFANILAAIALATFSYKLGEVATLTKLHDQID